jgi:addiction module HigA family antidote
MNRNGCSSSIGIGVQHGPEYATRQRKRKPTHVGIFFKTDVLKPLGLTISQAAKAIGVSRKHLSALVNGNVPCSKDMAQRLALATETSVANWLAMQTAVDVWEAENLNRADYKNIEPLNKLLA